MTLFDRKKKPVTLVNGDFLIDQEVAVRKFADAYVRALDISEFIPPPHNAPKEAKATVRNFGPIREKVIAAYRASVTPEGFSVTRFNHFIGSDLSTIRGTNIVPVTALPEAFKTMDTSWLIKPETLEGLREMMKEGTVVLTHDNVIMREIMIASLRYENSRRREGGFKFKVMDGDELKTKKASFLDSIDGNDIVSLRQKNLSTRERAYLATELIRALGPRYEFKIVDNIGFMESVYSKVTDPNEGARIKPYLVGGISEEKQKVYDLAIESGEAGLKVSLGEKLAERRRKEHDLTVAQIKGLRGIPVVKDFSDFRAKTGGTKEGQTKAQGINTPGGRLA